MDGEETHIDVTLCYKNIKQNNIITNMNLIKFIQ